MASPGQERGTCTHIMAFLTPILNVRGEKGLGTDPCVDKKKCEICDSFSTEQKKKLATPYLKKASSPTPL